MANKTAQSIHTVFDRTMAVNLKNKSTDKHEVWLFDKYSSRLQTQVLQSEAEITCVTSTTSYLLIGSAEKRVQVFKIDSYEAPVATIQVNAVPTELVNFQNEICICL